MILIFFGSFVVFVNDVVVRVMKVVVVVVIR